MDKQIEENVISFHSCEPAKVGVACLLCGKFIETSIPRPIICNECKELWNRLKEVQNGQAKAN